MKEAITPAGQGLSGAPGEGGRTLRGQEESGVVNVFCTVGAASRIYADVFKQGGHRTGPLSTYTALSEKAIQQVGWEASGVGLSPFHPQHVSSGFPLSLSILFGVGATLHLQLTYAGLALCLHLPSTVLGLQTGARRMSAGLTQELLDKCSLLTSGAERCVGNKSLESGGTGSSSQLCRRQS